MQYYEIMTVVKEKNLKLNERRGFPKLAMINSSNSLDLRQEM